jgi:hypothetical protein
MINKRLLVPSLLSVLVVNACSSVSDDDRAGVSRLSSERDALVAEQKYYVSDMPYAKKTPIKATSVGDAWLQSKTFNMGKPIGAGTPMAEIVKAFGAIGVNIISTLPIESLNYYGAPISLGTTADSALQFITEQMGLDYEVVQKYGSTPYVRITEMGNLTYRLRVPDVITSLNMASPLTLSQVGESSNGNGGQGQSASQGAGSSNRVGSNQGASQGGNSSGGQNNSGGVYTSYQTQFWDKLEQELTGMMRIIAPTDPNNQRGNNQAGNEFYGNNGVTQAFSMGMQQPVFSQGSQNAAAASGEKVVGRVVVNSLTGNISVTAPRHIRQRIATYLDDIDDELNTRISVKTRIVSVTRTAEESRGWDIAGFKNFAGDKYGLAVTNNVLGEVTISDLADGVRRVSASDALSQSIIGVTRADKAFEAFFAYLQSTGQAESVSNLSGTANSGRTMFLRRAGNDPVLRSSITQATTDSGNTVGGSNSIIEQNYTGTSMKITPVYNTRRGLVNALIDIEMVLDAGEKPQTEQILAGDTIKPNTIFLKKQDSINIQTQSVARMGETIVVGNFTTEQQLDNESGITGLRESFVGDLFGKKNKRTVMTDYFVLLTVEAHRYGAE